MKQTILIMILFLFSNMLSLFMPFMCDIPLLPFISLIMAFESGFTVTGESEGSPPECSTYPSYNNWGEPERAPH